MEIHTSGRISYKRCRRRWALTDDASRALEAVDASSFPLWFGTGFHFGMEDLHGYNRFGSPGAAFEAYVSCFARSELPEQWKEGVELAKGMFDYYLMWREKHPEFDTLWLNGEPQVEVVFVIDLPTWNPTTGEQICDGFQAPSGSEQWDPDETAFCEKCSRTEAQHNTYAGRFDRVVVDDFGRWWVEDYKTAQRFDTQKLPTDVQVTSYTWAASHMYGKAFEGVVYSQFLKEVPHAPARLANGGFSVNKKQATTFAVYLKALLDEYGVQEIPAHQASRQDYVKVRDDMYLPQWVLGNYGEVLQTLRMQETAEGDRFIRRDLVRRNQIQAQSEYRKILIDTYEMTNPFIQKLWVPNPTKDCAWDCPVRQVCISMDDGSDFEQLLAEGFRKRTNVWRDRLVWPRERLGLPKEEEWNKEAEKIPGFRIETEPEVEPVQTP